MTPAKVSKLEPYDIRKIWKKEEKDFTPWLYDHMEILSDRLDLELSALEREKRTGSFETDIFAEDQDSNSVIIENQFGMTDHDHLGKGLTYLSTLDAKTLIWICEEPRPEHIKTISWLNESTPPDISFYLVKVEAYSINGSLPAPNFNIIAGPSPIIKEAGVKRKELAERHLLRLEFWKQLLEKSAKKTSLFRDKNPSKDNWIYISSGRPGLGYSYVILMNSARVELYIDTNDQDANKKIFDELYSKREKIESDFGEEMDWQRLDTKRACRIASWIRKKGLKTEDKWSDLQDVMIDKMIKLEAIFRKYI